MAKQAEVPKGVTTLQVRDLTKRIERVSSSIIYGARNKAQLAEPANVKAARRVLDAFEEKNRKACNAAADKGRARVDAVKKLVLYGGDMQKAVAAVELLEQEARK